MSYTGICKNNILKINKLPNKKEVELFEEIFKSKNLLFERIISNGWNRIEDKWYDQDADEWVLLIKGFASIEFEKNNILELEEGDYIFIPAHYKHRVIKTSLDPACIWLAIHISSII